MAGSRSERAGQGNATVAGQRPVPPPGSDWLYLIFNGPRASEDALLAGPLGALAEHLVEQGDADGWFYVRYSDPEPQLRLRIHGDAATLTGRVLPALSGWGACAIADRARTRFTIETYERELERYGGPATTEICERIACVDSRTARLLIRASAGMTLTRLRGREAAMPPGEPAGGLKPEARTASSAPLDRLEVALVSAAGLTASLVSDPAERLCLCNDAAGPAAQSGVLFRERQARLRALVAAIEPDPAAAVVADEHTSATQWRRVREALEERRTRLAPLVAQLTDRCREGASPQSVGQLVPSLIHMHANRLGLNRTDEQLMLGLLDRTLRSIRAYPVTATS